MNEKKKPEWVPEHAGKEFTTSIMPGMDEVKRQSSHKHPTRKDLDMDVIVQGVLSGNRTLLSRAITMIESNSLHHFAIAQNILKELLPYAGKSIRIGITGTPGAGKSTFIESFGLWLIESGHKVAVLAIDPSSSISKGSILGDKTRMEELSRADQSFIRPSPSSGVLGGVARKTRETIVLCEAAGYDIILIETVGVGQSEITVRSMVDFFLLMQISGAGDELQGIKKGIMELADLILINKADGDNVLKAQSSAGELNNVLHYLHEATPGWHTKALTCSAIHKEGLEEVWKQICDFCKVSQESGFFYTRRKQQNQAWFDDMLSAALLQNFFANPQIMTRYKELKEQIDRAEISPAAAVHTLLKEDIS